MSDSQRKVRRAEADNRDGVIREDRKRKRIRIKANRSWRKGALRQTWQKMQFRRRVTRRS